MPGSPINIPPGSALDDALGENLRDTCSEVCALNQAESAEGPSSIFGGAFRTLRVRSLESPMPSGTPADPCEESCQPLSGDSVGTSNRENYERFGKGVGIALREAGWPSGRSVDVTKWVQQLDSVGYLVSPYARQVWAEFGNLNIRSLPSRVPKSSLRVDPVDAGIDTVDEAQRLAVRLQATFAPLGTWSSQFRAYVGDRGRVVAVGPHSAWFLGDTIEGALRFIVEGDGRGITRPDIEEWILLIIHIWHGRDGVALSHSEGPARPTFEPRPHSLVVLFGQEAPKVRRLTAEQVQGVLDEANSMSLEGR